MGRKSTIWPRKGRGLDDGLPCTTLDNFQNCTLGRSELGRNFGYGSASSRTVPDSANVIRSESARVPLRWRLHTSIPNRISSVVFLCSNRKIRCVIVGPIVVVMPDDIRSGPVGISSHKSVGQFRNYMAYELIFLLSISTNHLERSISTYASDADYMPTKWRFSALPSAIFEAPNSEFAAELISGQRRNVVPEFTRRVIINDSHDLLLLQSNGCGQSPAGPQSLSGSHYHINSHQI